MASSFTNITFAFIKFPSFPVHTGEIIVKRRMSRALYQCTPLPSYKQKYDKLANYLKKKLVNHKTKYFQSFLSNLLQNIVVSGERQKTNLNI